MALYYGLIPDIRGKRVLVVPESEGRWTLPSFGHDDGDWFAWVAPAIARGAAERFGVAMTALHERSIGDCLVCELEIQAPEWLPPEDARWIARDDLAAMTFEPAALLPVFEAWFAEQQSGVIPELRPPWERRGWHEEASAWIVSQCQRLGFTPSGPVEQVKAAWSLSAILKLNTAKGTLYFKADRARPPSEPLLIERLAQRWPRNLPAIVAADPARGCMMMRDFGQGLLDHEPIGVWLSAVGTFSVMQLALSSDLEPWRELGCPDFRIPALIAIMDRMFADALTIGAPDGLSETSAARLRSLQPRLHAMWRELAALPIPDTLVQQDFRHGNLVIQDGDYIFFDWSDSVIGHPFFSLCRFLDYLHHAPDPALSLEERGRRITDAYLAPWRDVAGDADLRRAMDLARQLNPVYVAIRRYLDVPWCEPGSFWSRYARQGVIKELSRLLAEWVEA